MRARPRQTLSKTACWTIPSTPGLPAFGIWKYLKSCSAGTMKIRRFRLKEALRRTLLRRPDLLERRTLSKEERQLLEELVQEHSCEGRVNTNEPN